MILKAFLLLQGPLAGLEPELKRLVLHMIQLDPGGWVNHVGAGCLFISWGVADGVGPICAAALCLLFGYAHIWHALC